MLRGSWEVPKNLYDDLEKFTYTIHGRLRVGKVNEMHFIKIMEQCAREDYVSLTSNVGMEMLPLRKFLVQLICSVGYHVAYGRRPTLQNWKSQ